MIGRSLGLSGEFGRGTEMGREEENISSALLLHHLLGSNPHGCSGSSGSLSGCCLYHQNCMMKMICMPWRLHRKRASIPDQHLNLVALTPAPSCTWVWGYFFFSCFVLSTDEQHHTKKESQNQSQTIHISIIKTETFKGLESPS